MARRRGALRYASHDIIFFLGNNSLFLPMESSPSQFLQNLLGKRIVLRLNNGTDIAGTLLAVDGAMNLAMAKAEALPGPEPIFPPTSLRGDVFVRGNNGIISVQLY